MKNKKIITILCSILFLSAIGCSEVRRFHYESGELRWEANFKESKQEGLSKEYYRSGPLRWEVNYKEGKQEGLSKEYYRSGGLKSEINYMNGQREGLSKTYYVSGELRWEVNYKEGKQEGLSKEYYRSGGLRSESNYKDGQREGLSKTYYESGEILFIATYKKGQQIDIKSYNKLGKLKFDKDFPCTERNNMAEKLDQKEIVTPDEHIYSSMVQIEAITRLLVKKGIITKDELQVEYEELMREAKK